MFTAGGVANETAEETVRRAWWQQTYLESMRKGRDADQAKTDADAALKAYDEQFSGSKASEAEPLHLTHEQLEPV
jgi:hypothetical protein